MKSKRTYIVIALLALCMGGVYWLFQEDAPPPTAKTPLPPPMLSYHNNVLSEEKDGKKAWELKAETIEVDPQTKNAAMENIQGVFYQENGKTVTVTAPKARYEEKSRNITLTERVKAVSSDGVVLDADTMRWDGARQSFFSQGNVKLTRGDTVLTSHQLESNPGFSKFTATGSAHIVKGGAQQ